MKNTTCKQCGTRFHSCSSCGLQYQYEHEYCSHQCWLTSEKYRVIHEACQLLNQTLTNEQRAAIRTVLERGEDAIQVLEVTLDDQRPE